MRFAAKILLFNFFLIFLGFLIYSYESKTYLFSETFFLNESEKSEVLSAVASTEVFDVVTEAKILQYPVITYSDSRPVPLESSFQVIRRYSNPSKFTNHLCNPVNESNAAWRSDSLGCPNYNKDPKFIKLNFGSSNQRLLLYNNFSLFSIDNPNKTVKFQSLHLDRFLNSNIVECAKYDPATVYPVFSNGAFYLVSKFMGSLDTNCLYFWDHVRNSRSTFTANDRLLLGFEVLSNGELNRNYNRGSYSAISGVPYGPGPQNTSIYTATIPTNEIIGCSRFDSNTNCTQLLGLNNYTYSYVPTGSLIRTNQCKFGTCKFPNNRAEVICNATWNCDINSCLSCCQRKVGYDCSTGKPKAKCPPGFREVRTTACKPVSYYTDCCGKVKYSYYSGGSFNAHLNTYTLSSFNSFNSQEIRYNIVGSTSPNSAVVLNIPSDYTCYTNELNNPNNINYPINFTNEFNRTVFTSNKYLFKVTKDNSNLTIRRYALDTSRTYSFGSSTYIGSSSTTVSITLTSGSLNDFSLDYFNDDIYFLASGGGSYDFYKLQNFNSNSAITSIKINELSDKFPVGYKTPTVFGIAPEGEDPFFYFLNNDKVFYTTFKDPVIVFDPPPITTKYFQFNGNVFSKDSLTTGFMFNNSNTKFQGSYVTSQNFNSNLKFLNNSLLSLTGFSPLPITLKNFSSFNNGTFSKFNILSEDISFNENVPLAASQYLNFNPTSTNKFEIINISEGKGIRIDLNNSNIVKNFDKYVLINMDKNNRSRINFYVDCSNAAYSLICSGVKFNFKGALLGQFYISGKLNSIIENERFVRVHENADTLINLVGDLRSKKYQSVTSTIVILNYE